MTIIELAAKYEEATNTFMAAVSELPQDLLDVAPQGEWTARKVIHHQAHADAYCLTRIIQVVSEPGTPIRSFSEAALVESRILDYAHQPIEPSIALLKALRAETLRIIKSASDADLTLSCQHSAMGEITMEAMINRYTDHPLEHAGQIREIITKGR